jgi:hypothetical protein
MTATATLPRPAPLWPVALLIGGVVIWLLRVGMSVSIDRSFPRRTTPVADAGGGLG